MTTATVQELNSEQSQDIRNRYQYWSGVLSHDLAVRSVFNAVQPDMPGVSQKQVEDAVAPKVEPVQQLTPTQLTPDNGGRAVEAEHEQRECHTAVEQVAQSTQQTETATDELLDFLMEDPVAPTAPDLDLLPKVPIILKTFPNWVTWESVDKKAPIISGTQANAKSDDPSTWVTYPQACENIRAGKGFKNLGFVTDGERASNLTGIDIDGCRDPQTGKITDWALSLLKAVGATYVEVTPSKTGLRAWVIASLPKGAAHVTKLALTAGFGSKVQVEIYDDRKYFTMTGDQLAGSSSEVARLNEAQLVKLFELLEYLSAQYPSGAKKEEKRRPRTRPVRKPDGGYIFEPIPPDEGFKNLGEAVGWEPLVNRMNKMSDARFHDATLQPGKMTYCPMPGHQPRGENLRYTACFGLMKDGELAHCFGCGFTGDVVKACREFDAGDDGGHIEYTSMYDAARVICQQAGLKFEDFFPSEEKHEQRTVTVNAEEPVTEYAMTAAAIEAEHEKPYPVFRLVERGGPTWDDDLMYGIAGQIVRKAAEYNEAHPAGMYLDFLVSMGSIFGRHAYFNVNSTAHYTNEFMVRVGQTSDSRKGSGRDAIDEVLRLVDSNWQQLRVMNGFGSAQAIINELKDAVEQHTFSKKKNAFNNIVVPGVEDKRLCVREGELASVFQLAGMKDSRADIVLRDGWDSKALHNIVKGSNHDGFSNSVHCQQPHLSISGDTTKSELLRKMPNGADENGFGNRFLYCYVYRTKKCPLGGPQVDWADMLVQLLKVVEYAKQQKYIPLSKAAEKMWSRMYLDLESNRPAGLAGKMTARGPAHVRRLALILALLDMSAVVESRHLQAARKLWDYCQESAEYIFSGCTRDQRRILNFVGAQQGASAGTGVTEVQVREELFHRNQRAGWITAQLNELIRMGNLMQSGERYMLRKAA